MKSAKVRKMERKDRAKEVNARKSDIHRKRRLDNKAKREAIHAIDPNMKVIIVDQKTFDEHGTEIEVMNGKVRAAKLDDEIIKATMELCNEPDKEIGKAIDKQIEKERLSMFSKFTDRFKSK